LIFTLSSFHIPYYAGRKIPNFMALPLGESFNDLDELALMFKYYSAYLLFYDQADYLYPSQSGRKGYGMLSVS